MDTNITFTYDNLKIFYKKIKDLGSTYLFKEWKGEKVFLIRHDVDFDVYLAYKMAILEFEMGIKSTFFILTSSPSYNILEKKNKNYLREIIKMGHEVGLHFDPRLYKENLKEAVKKEIEILSFVTNEKIYSISLHSPSVHGQYPLFEGLINTYDPQFFSDNNYISDSCFSFRNKNPFLFLNNINNSMIQILLHPMHFSNTKEDYIEIFDKGFKRYQHNIHTNFFENPIYQKQFKDKFLKNHP